jgi:hypothetical protein
LATSHPFLAEGGKLCLSGSALRSFDDHSFVPSATTDKGNINRYQSSIESIHKEMAWGNITAAAQFVLLPAGSRSFADLDSFF